MFDSIEVVEVYKIQPSQLEFFSDRWSCLQRYSLQSIILHHPIIHSKSLYIKRNNIFKSNFQPLPHLNKHKITLSILYTNLIEKMHLEVTHWTLSLTPYCCRWGLLRQQCWPLPLLIYRAEDLLGITLFFFISGVGPCGTIQ